MFQAARLGLLAGRLGYKMYKRARGVRKVVGRRRRPRRPLRLRRRSRVGSRLRSRKRSRAPGGSYTRSKRRRIYDTGDGAYHQLDQLPTIKRTLGRFTRRKDSYLNRRIIVYRFQGVKQLATTPPHVGYAGLEYYDAGAITNFPLHIYDLTQCVNNNNGNIITGRPGYVLRVNDTTGGIEFANLTGQNNAGVGSTELQTEYNPSFGYPFDRSILKWVQIKLNLHGCVQKPTKFEITLCQLNEQVQTTGMGGSFSGTGNIQLGFWQSLIRNMTHNNLDTTQYPEVKRSLRVWKRFTYVIQPTSSSENDSAPHQKVVNYFFRMNRRMRYDWQQTQKNILTPANMEANGWEVMNNENNAGVDPKARVFLMIRALNTVKLATAPTDSSTTPSYDFIMRFGHAVTR